MVADRSGPTTTRPRALGYVRLILLKIRQSPGLEQDWTGIAVVLGGTVLSTLASGYRLDDLLIYLPMTAYLRDNSLYPGNPLIEQLLSMPYPAYRAYAIAFDERFLFVIFAIARIGLVAGLWRLGRRMLRDPLAAAGGTLLLVATPGWFGTLGGTSLLQSEPSQFALAVPLCVFALSEVLANCYQRSLVLAALAFNLQPILGGIVLTFVGADLVLDAAAGRGQLSLKRACLLLCLTAVLLLPAVSVTIAGLGTKLVEGTSDYVQIVRFTAFYQIFPSTFPPHEYASSALVFIGALFAVRKGIGGHHRVSLTLWLILVAVFCIAGTAFSELWPVTLVLKLMPFRATLFLKVIGLLLIAGLLRRSLADARVGRFAAATAAVMLCAWVVRSARPIHIPGISSPTDLEQAAAWARADTPVDALFATPPDPTSAGFTFFSERSTLGDYKLDTQAVWDPWFAHLAYERLAALGCEGPWNPWCSNNRYASFDEDAFRVLRQRYGVCYVLTRQDQELAFNLLYRNSSYRVYSLCDDEPDRPG